SPGSVWIVAAKVTGRLYSSTQSKVIGRAPERPARIADQVSGAVPPTGVVAPRPVTTTRLDVLTCLLLETRGCDSGWGGGSDGAMVGPRAGVALSARTVPLTAVGGPCCRWS